MARAPRHRDLPTGVGTKTMSTVKYVVGSQTQQWVESPRIRTGWQLGNDGRRAPEGLRHAVDANVTTAACGLPGACSSSSTTSTGQR